MINRLTTVVLTLLYFLALLYISGCNSYLLQGDYSDINPESTLKCHRREFTYKVVRKDKFGRKCYGYITAMSCWGRCDSNEIADWRFPFKKSYHPVCMHDEMILNRIELTNCDKGAEREARIYEYIEAVSCSCQICQSSIASCQAMHYRQVNEQ
ncbi:gpb5 (predicted) [Pycnogonum litorale]